VRTSSGSAAAAAAADNDAAAAAAALLPWLARVTDDASLESRVAVADTQFGRGLVAKRKLIPGEVIFNIPFDLVFAESPRGDGSGAGRAWRILLAASSNAL
jgi:hypothetical protein